MWRPSSTRIPGWPRTRCGTDRNDGARLGVPQPGQDGEHAAVIVGRLLEPELREDARDVCLDGLVPDDERRADRPVRSPLRHQREDLALARGQIHEWILLPTT